MTTIHRWHDTELYFVNFLFQIILFTASILYISQLVRDRKEKKTDSDDIGKTLGSESSRRPSSDSHTPMPNAGVASMAQNLLGAFSGFSNADLLNEYTKPFRTNPTPGDLLGQLLIGSQAQFYNNLGMPNNNFNIPNNFNMPNISNMHTMPNISNMYSDQQRGPVIVQLPNSPPLRPTNNLHNTAMMAIEGPEEHSSFSDTDDSFQRRQTYARSRCQSDGNIMIKPVEEYVKELPAKLLRRDTYR